MRIKERSSRLFQKQILPVITIGNVDRTIGRICTCSVVWVWGVNEEIHTVLTLENPGKIATWLFLNKMFPFRSFLLRGVMGKETASANKLQEVSM